MKTLLGLFIICIGSWANAASPYINLCAVKAWGAPRTTDKTQIFGYLDMTDKSTLANILFAELFMKDPKKSLALPIALYLGNTEVDDMMRGFWLLIATIITEGQPPELAYKSWPQNLSDKKFPLTQVDLCRKYKEALSKSNYVKH